MGDKGGTVGRLDGKRALITGVSRGIGRGIAEAFAREGADVAGTYLPSEPAPEAVREAIETVGRRAFLYPADVAVEEQMVDAVRMTLGRFRQIDILVANAGYAEETPVATMSVDQWDRMMAVHLRGTFLAVRHVLPGMRERRSGVIITVASQLAYLGAANLAHYAAAKGGIISFTRSLAREVSRDNVRVNGIAPGPIETGILPSTPEDNAALAASLPIGRLGRVDEVAPTAVFLASDDASYYVGQILGPNGGDAMP